MNIKRSRDVQIRQSENGEAFICCVEDDDDVEEILVNSDEVLSPAYVSSLPLQEKQSKAKEGIKITALLLLASVALGVALLYLRFVLVCSQIQVCLIAIELFRYR